MPKFSILVPTRNRASLLKDCLQTAIALDFDDYEIVVSDNNSQDNTKNIVDGYRRQSDKIRYVNPGRDLSMCDNFEFVFSHALGEYVIYLSDDDAPTDLLLPCLDQLLNRFETDVVVFERGYYQHPDIPDAGLRGTFLYQIGTGTLHEVTPDFVIQALCDFEVNKVNALLPKMLNCAVSRHSLQECATRTGRFFLPPFPDYSAACQLLGHVQTYYWLDLPLYICGASLFSNAGIQYNRKQKFKDYVSLFGHDLLAGTPYPMTYLNQSYFLSTFVKFKQVYPEVFNYPVNTTAYLRALFNELVVFKDYEDISEELKILKNYMFQYSQSNSMFEELMQEHNRHQARFGSLSRRILYRNKILYRLARKIKDSVANLTRQQSAAKSYLSVPSITEASRILSKELNLRAPKMAELQAQPLKSLVGFTSR